MKPLFILISSIVLNAICTYQTTVDIGELFETRWICSNCENVTVQKHFTFIPSSSNMADSLNFPQRFGGLQFYEDGKMRQYNWRKCGNDNSPPYYEVNYQLSESDSRVVIEITEPIHSRWKGKFKIIHLSAGSLKIQEE
jgi:hypothetical protein